MVGRKRPILRGERGPVLVRQLLGVEADAKAVVRCGLEQALDLLRREGDGIAKGVDAGGKAGPGRHRDQLFDNLRHIMRATVALVRRQRVQREQGGNDAHRLSFAQLAGELEQPHLVSDQPIAGLDLDRRAAAVHQGAEAAAALVEKLVVPRGGSPARSKRCRHRLLRSPRRWRRRGASHVRRRGCRRRRGGCGSRSGPA